MKDEEWPTLTNLSRKQVIVHYHTLQKQLAAVDKDKSFPNEAARDARRRVLRARLQVVGGLEGYQMASLEGELEHGNFDASQWVLEYLRSQKTDDSNVSVFGNTIRILDVGSIVQRFPDHFDKTALAVTSIDLRTSIDPNVLQADLIDYAREHGRRQENEEEEEKQKKFDVVCLCLCVNFEGCPCRRADMFDAAAKLIHEKGLVFIALPRPCIDNSRYLDETRLSDILANVGLAVEHVRRTASLWLAVFKACERQPRNSSDTPLSKRMVVRTGENRNNFTILLPGKDGHDRNSERGSDYKDMLNRGELVQDEQRRMRGSRGGKKNKKKSQTQSGLDPSASVQKRTSNQRARARKKRAKMSKKTLMNSS